jgi:predicted transcriptional regulator
MRKAGPVRELPPRLELECLKALWVIGEGSVKQVRERLHGNRALAYTTVMTVLDRLAKRGGVQRRKVGRSFVYAPVLTQDCVRRLAIKDLVDSYFEGSPDLLRVYLLQESMTPLVMMAAAADGVDSRLDASLL